MKKNIRIGFTIIGECTFENSTILQSVTKIFKSVFSVCISIKQIEINGNHYYSRN
mgnify:FL=1